MIRRVLLVILAAATVGCSVGAVGCPAGGRKGLAIAAGEEATGDANAGRTLARALREHGGFAAAAGATTGPVENLQRLRAGDADLALTTADVLADAVNGQGVFRGATVPARTIATLSDAVLHLIVARDSPINGFSGLRGRRVSSGEVGTATELTSLRVLREALLDPQRDVVRQSLGVTDSMTALREGRIDAFFWLGPVPVDVVRDATEAGSLSIRLLSTASVVPLLQKRFGESLYSAVEFPVGAYGNGEQAAGVGVAQVLVARADLPDAVAYGVARALFGPGGSPRIPHPPLEGITRARAGRAAPAALHPGAARYYRQTNP